MSNILMKETLIVSKSYILVPGPESSCYEKQLTVINWLEEYKKETFLKCELSEDYLIYNNFPFQTFRQVACPTDFLKWYGSALKKWP